MCFPASRPPRCSALGGDRGAGRAAHADRSRSPGRTASIIRSIRARTRDRRRCAASITSRSAATATRPCTCRRLASPSAAKADYKDFAFTIGGAVVRNQIFVRFAGEGSDGLLGGASLLKGRQHVDNTLVINHAVGALRQPRAVQVGARRREPRRVPGQDHRRAARAEDRRQDDDARAAAVGRRRGRQQAGARDLRRRRGLRPRRDRRRARSGS